MRSNKSKDPKFTGPKSAIVNNTKYTVNQSKLIHIKTGNEFLVKEIQVKGFIVWLVKSLGAEVHNEQNMYISYGQLNEYR